MMGMTGFLVRILCVVLLAGPALGEEIRGQASVVDGDTLEIGVRQVRLLGVDAYEAAQEQPLKTGGTDFLGRGAAMMLRSLITSQSIRCKVSDQADARGLPLATCFSNATDLARAMVANGIARVAETHPSPYLQEEAQARREKRGFWRDTAEKPWQFRKRKVTEASRNAPNGCPFKGVVIDGRRTLVAPWSPWYADVKVKTEAEDRWLCTEKQAVSAGWYEPLWLIQSVVTGVYNPGN